MLMRIGTGTSHREHRLLHEHRGSACREVGAARRALITLDLRPLDTSVKSDIR